MRISLGVLPGSLREFQALSSMNLARPEDTCMLFLCALNLYLRDPAAGVAAMNLLRGPRPMNGYDIQFLRDRLRGKPYLPLAYFTGALPENGYRPRDGYELEVLPDASGQEMEEDYRKVFLKTAGADAPRPITLRRKGEMWYLWEYSSILTGIRLPAESDPWA